MIVITCLLKKVGPVHDCYPGTLQRQHAMVSDPLIVLPVITVNQPNGAVAKESKNTPMSCEKSRKELQNLMRILSRIPTRSLVHKFAWVHNYLTHRTAAIKKWQTSVWKFPAKHRLLLSAATLLFAVWCLASSASSERSTESKYLKGSKIVNKCAL